MGGNPYRMDYQQIVNDVKTKMNMDEVYTRHRALELQGKKMTAEDYTGAGDEAFQKFQRLGPDEMNELVEARMNEYLSMFESDNVNASVRQAALENISKQMDDPTQTDDYIERVGNEVINTFSSLFWKVNKIKNKAMGVVTDEDVMGHTIRSYVGLHGDQSAIQQYAKTLESVFRNDVESATEKIMVELADSSNSRRIKDAILDVTGFVGGNRDRVKITEADIQAALVHAMDSNAKMGRLIRDVPQLKGAMKAYLRHQQQWEGVIRRSPHLKEYFTPAYVMHRYKGMMEFTQSHPGATRS